MYEAGGEIKIRGKSYPLLFNVAALEEVTKRYGGIAELGEQLAEDLGKAIGEYVWVIALLISQGTALRNFENSTDERPLTPDQISLLMAPHEIFGGQSIVIEAINKGMGADQSNDDAEEEVDEVLEEVLQSKNVESAEG